MVPAIIASLLGFSVAQVAAGFGPAPALPRPGTPNVTLSWYDAVTDHFAFDVPAGVPSTFKQRVFTYDKYWNKETGAIWFYCGNEANVELYINATGLMWENAKAAGALLVFAEHRYYGDTLIFPGDQDKLPASKMHWLTMEQALADYALVIKNVKEKVYNTDQPVVAFGGSYGGMLAAWLRMKYPASVQGAIAASAPILAFGKEYNSNSFWQVVTRDATPAAGAAPGCDTAVRSTWPVIDTYGATDAGRATLSKVFKLCTPLKTAGDVYGLKLMMLNAWDTMSMGNFPFPSNYLVFQQTGDPSVLLPAFPVRVSCDHMVKPPTSTGNGLDLADDLTLLANMRDAAGVLYNVSHNEKCFVIPDDPNYDGIWDYQWCSELLPQETYFTLDGKHDMFWDQPMNMTAIDAHCKGKYGFAPRADWIATEFGGMDGVNAASNIVFTSGLYDPWSSGGVGVKEAAAAKDRVASFGIDGTVKAVVLDHGAHHLDLMFSNPADTPDVLNARQVELAQIHAWTHPKTPATSS